MELPQKATEEIEKILKKVLTKTISFIIIIYVAEEHSKQQKRMRQ